MIPLYDTVRSHKFPLITVALIAANILVFFHESQLGPYAFPKFIYTWGLIPWLFSSNPSSSWLYVFTSMFVHGGWLHLFSNMWVLFVFGQNVEADMGSFRYLIFYLLAGAAAALLQIYAQPESPNPMVGASGAIAGILGAYLILFPRARIASLVFLIVLFTIVEIPAPVFLLLWMGMQVYSGLFTSEAGSGIAWWAHIGGFVFGAVMVSLFAVRRRAIYGDWQ
jgi:membrane associated rhomboid family serine protease